MRMQRTAVGLAAAFALVGVAVGAPAPAPANPDPAHPTAQPPISNAEAERARAALAPTTNAEISSSTQTSYAVVEPTGVLARGFQAVYARRINVGTYEVIFNRDLTTSAYLATLGLSGNSGTPNPGEIAVIRRSGTTNGIFVQTFDSAGTLTDQGFHIAALS